MIPKNFIPIVQKLNNIILSLGAQNSDINAPMIENYIKSRKAAKMCQNLNKKGVLNEVVLRVNLFDSEKKQLCQFSLYSVDNRNWLQYYLICASASANFTIQQAKEALKNLNNITNTK